MADLLVSYNALSPSSPRADVARVLNALITGAVLLNRLVSYLTLIQHPSSTILVVRPWSPLLYRISSLANRVARAADSIILVHVYVYASTHRSTECRLLDAHLALSAIKALGRHPSGSFVIASASNLSILLTVSKNFSSSNLDASLEALRCIANTLLLVESARNTLTSDTVNGGEYAVHLLEVGYL